MRRNQQTVGQALRGVMGSMEQGSKLRESLAIGFWEEVVGPQAAAATEPDCVRDGVLFVRTKHSVWSHELTFLKAHIISELNLRAGRGVIKEIIFQARGVAPKTQAVVPARQPSAEELAGVVLPPSEHAQLQRDVAALQSIEDEGIRQRTAARIARERRLRRWRLENGWRECPRCRDVHAGDQLLCNLCRVCP